MDARLDEEEEEDAAAEGVTVPEAFEHETFLDERGNITGRALYVCITSFWLRVYYNLAQFELNERTGRYHQQSAGAEREGERMV